MTDSPEQKEASEVVLAEAATPQEEPVALDSDSVSEDVALDDQALAAAPEVLEEPESLEASQPESVAVATPEGEEALEEEPCTFPWYVVHAYSGYEMRAKLSLEERVRSANLTHRFGRILVPEEKIVELVRGEKKTSKRKFFPGYILVQCELDEETWHLVKDTPKVTGFVGDSINPVPLSGEEVKSLVEQMEGGAKRARPSVKFEQGDSIKVVDGPFADFNGTVDEVKPDKGKLRVLISIFGRNTPVELDFVQVEKV